MLNPGSSEKFLAHREMPPAAAATGKPGSSWIDFPPNVLPGCSAMMSGPEHVVPFRSDQNVLLKDVDGGREMSAKMLLMINALPVGKLTGEQYPKPLEKPLRVSAAKFFGVASVAVTAPSTVSEPPPSPTASFPAESTLAK